MEREARRYEKYEIIASRLYSKIVVRGARLVDSALSDYPATYLRYVIIGEMSEEVIGC